MSTITAIFTSREQAETAMTALHGRGITEKQMNLLTPGDTVHVKTGSPVSGKSLGAMIGGVLGMGASTFLVPGLGPVIGAGMIAAGLAGAGLGAAAGAAAKRHTAGVPNEDLFFYEDALRRGQAIVIVEAKDGDETTRVRNALEHAGGIGLDKVRRDWWASVRGNERDYARSRGMEFEPNEANYQSGFEAALHPGTRGRAYDQCVAYIETCYPEPCRSDVFRIAFDRGQQYLSRQTGGNEVM